jgi:PBP1b-binding outer membrane lipoprotein LpoB
MHKEGRIAFLIAAICVLLAGCSTDVENLAAVSTDPPAAEKVLNSLKNVAITAKLQEPVETSAPIKAPAVSSFPWIICLRSGATEVSERLTYSVFYNNNELKDFRLSAIIERCDSQSYSLLK